MRRKLYFWLGIAAGLVFGFSDLLTKKQIKDLAEDG